LRAGAILQGNEIIASVVIKNFKCVKSAIHADGNVNEIISIGHFLKPFEYEQASCLEVALENGNVAIVQALLKAGAKVGPNEFISALREADCHLITKLFRRRLDGWVFPFTSVLEAALYPGDPAPEIIDLAFDICAGDYDGGSLCAAVQLAIRSDDSQVVRRILDNRPDCQEPHILEGTVVAIAASCHGE
jgi:hypothetical protein